MAFIKSNACRSRRENGNSHGFTLIELMVAIAIIAILSAIALPSYLQYVRRGNRAAAQTEMMSIATLQQQYFLSNRVFTSALSDLGYVLPSNIATRYTAAVMVNGALTGGPLTCQASGSGVPSFCITFTAIGSQVPDSNLTMDSFGVKARNGDTTKWSSL